MADDQRHGRIFGVLFIITFITSICPVALFQPVLDDPAGYIGGDGKDNHLGIYCAIWGFRKDSPVLRPTWRGNASA